MILQADEEEKKDSVGVAHHFIMPPKASGRGRPAKQAWHRNISGLRNQRSVVSDETSALPELEDQSDSDEDLGNDWDAHAGLKPAWNDGDASEDEDELYDQMERMRKGLDLSNDEADWLPPRQKKERQREVKGEIQSYID